MQAGGQEMIRQLLYAVTLLADLAAHPALALIVAVPSEAVE